MKIPKKKNLGGGPGGVGGGGSVEGSGWGVRVDVNEELKFFVKIKKKKIFFGGGVGGGGRGVSGRGRVGVGGSGGGGSVGGVGGGVRVDVNEELKFL